MRAAMLLLGAASVASAPASAQEADSAARFVAAVREATAQFGDRDAAVRAGYRPIGPDFPGMGEHWISVPLLLGGRIDPLHPPILEYARIDGKPVLVGAAFAVLLKPGERPPTVGLPVGTDAWHYHGGTVSEESFVLGHAHGHGPPTDQSTVAVLHVWTGLDNPDGPFATDNWALPYVRLGLTPPAAAPAVEIAHAVALAAGGERYYLAVIKAAGGDSDAAAPILAAAAQDMREFLARGWGDSLGGRWVALRTAVEREAGAALP